jgi:hypothetical protein
MIYQELKDWFRSNELPETLDCEDMFLPNLQFTVDLMIKQIDESLAKGKPSEHAKIQKGKLQIIYNALKN